jgi:tRNA nucleotidyltransferase (CCA-adding enzyme)
MQIRITDDLNKIASILHTKGFCCYLVGGAVRNQLLGIEEKDYDLASDAYPEDIIRIFNKVIPTGIKHGTVTILFRGQSYEITTFRVDGKYSDGRRPDSIEFTSNIYEDLKRRDFTINSIAYDILKKKLIDPNNGLNDLKNKIIKAIGNPHERFQEDGLRPLRACRFAAQLNFKIEHETFYAIGKSTDKFR